MAKRKRRGRLTPQQRRFKAAAKKCKGRRQGAFQACMSRMLNRR